MGRINISNIEAEPETISELELIKSFDVYYSEDAIGRFDADLNVMIQKAKAGVLNEEQMDSLEKAIRDRSHLVKKIITRSDGRVTTKWVRPNGIPKEDGKAAKEQLISDAERYFSEKEPSDGSWTNNHSIGRTYHPKDVNGHKEALLYYAFMKKHAMGHGGDRDLAIAKHEKAIAELHKNNKASGSKIPKAHDPSIPKLSDAERTKLKKIEQEWHMVGFRSPSERKERDRLRFLSYYEDAIKSDDPYMGKIFKVKNLKGNEVEAVVAQKLSGRDYRVFDKSGGLVYNGISKKQIDNPSSLDASPVSVGNAVIAHSEDGKVYVGIALHTDGKSVSILGRVTYSVGGGNTIVPSIVSVKKEGVHPINGQSLYPEAIESMLKMDDAERAKIAGMYKNQIVDVTSITGHPMKLKLDEGRLTKNTDTRVFVLSHRVKHY